MSKSNFVFVLDAESKPLTPCIPGMARSLLKSGKASVFRRYPFTLILKKKIDSAPELATIKLDP
ncbi:MAG: RRXRR domain-containing protein, partial [Brasilonema sp.]